MNLLQGYNGSQLWDAAFIVQAIISTNLIKEYGPTLRKAHMFLKNSQVLYELEMYWGLFVWRFLVLYIFICFFIVLKVLEDCPGDLNFWYRHISKGAWPFSTADHGWPISDCTSEGLKVILFLNSENFPSYVFLTFASPSGCSYTIKNTARDCWRTIRSKAVIWCCKCYSVTSGNEFSAYDQSNLYIYLIHIFIRIWHNI